MKKDRVRTEHDDTSNMEAVEKLTSRKCQWVFAAAPDKTMLQLENALFPARSSKYYALLNSHAEEKWHLQAESLFYPVQESRGQSDVV
jgi:hypothetical protein